MTSSILQHVEESATALRTKAEQIVEEHNERMANIPQVALRVDKTTVIYFPKAKDTPEFREQLIDKYKNLKHEWR